MGVGRGDLGSGAGGGSNSGRLERRGGGGSYRGGGWSGCGGIGDLGGGGGGSDSWRLERRCVDWGWIGLLQRPDDPELGPSFHRGCHEGSACAAGRSATIALGDDGAVSGARELTLL